MPLKTCPQCNKGCGPRTRVCECGHEFSSKTGSSTPTSFTSTTSVGEAVSKESSVSKKKRKVRVAKVDSFQRVLNWRALRTGDKLKVRGGSYWQNPVTKARQYITDSGKAIVDCVEKNGVMVYEKNGGRGFLYMGRKCRSELCDNVWKNPHKLMIWCENGERPISTKTPEYSDS